MARMKKFTIYFCILVGFLIYSFIMENALLFNMYADISGSTDGHFEKNNSNLAIENVDANASNVDGYLKFDLKNTSEDFIDKLYVKVDLYNDQDLLADTEYIEVENMQPGESRPFNIKFKANNIKNYKISVEESAPDKSNIIDILGWEIDLTDVFGHDLTKLKVFGKNLVDILKNIKDKIDLNKIIGAGLGFWDWFINLAKSIPLWAYFGALFFL